MKNTKFDNGPSKKGKKSKPEPPAYMRRIRSLRLRSHLTQAEMAGMLKTSQSNYMRYELGYSKLPISMLIGLCRLCNVSADYLLGLDPVPQAPADLTDADTDGDVTSRAADQPNRRHNLCLDSEE